MNKTWLLRSATIGWLRYNRRCPLVCFERSPLGSSYPYRPDIIGVTRERCVIEVEIKQTLSDFRANAKKRVIQLGRCVPRQFYFAVPTAMVERVKPELPEHAGLLTLGLEDAQWGPQIKCVVSAKTRPSPRLSMRQIVEMAMHQTGSLHRCCVAISRMQDQLQVSRVGN